MKKTYYRGNYLAFTQASIPLIQTSTLTGLSEIFSQILLQLLLLGAYDYFTLSKKVFFTICKQQNKIHTAPEECLPQMKKFRKSVMPNITAGYNVAIYKTTQTKYFISSF